MKNLLTFVLAVLTIAATQAQKKIKGNGKVVTVERTTNNYDGVAVSGWFDVELVDGNEGTITITGEENLLEYLVTEVKDGKLSIKPKKGYYLSPSNWKNGGINITVPVEEISMVAMSGSGDIVGKKMLEADHFKTAMSGSGDITLEVTTQTMRVSMSGSGDIELEGKTRDLDVRISGSGDVSAFDLEADNVDATISGSADIKVTANKSLKARVSGSGDIYYKGNPDKLETKSSGSGDITKT